jgi:methylenetetrahydrofolate reductase (NADPH)
LPGVLITDDFQALLEEEAATANRGRTRALTRAALQMVALKRMGYSGVQFTMIHDWETVAEVMDRFSLSDRTLGDAEAWREAWKEALGFADGRVAMVAPHAGVNMFDGARDILPAKPPTPVPVPISPDQEKRLPEINQYRWLNRLDHWLFQEGSSGARLAGPVIARLRCGSTLERGLLGLEKLAKEPWVGCEGCGFCRLGDTFYVCPETCPKGLANGSCGGTDDNICEFGDRECVHNRIYRLAKHMDRLDELENLLIPAVTSAQRDTSSWPPHFRGEVPRTRQANRKSTPKSS